MEPQKPPKSQSNLEREQKWDVSYSLILNYITNLQKSEWYWDKMHTQKSMEHNRKPWKKQNPSIYGQLIYDKGGKNTQWRKDSLFSAVGNTGQLPAKEWN